MVPRGLYKLQQIELQGPCNASIEVQVDGTIQAPQDPSQLNGDAQWGLNLPILISLLGGLLMAKVQLHRTKMIVVKQALQEAFHGKLLINFSILQLVLVHFHQML